MSVYHKSFVRVKNGELAVFSNILQYILQAYCEISDALQRKVGHAI